MSTHDDDGPLVRDRDGELVPAELHDGRGPGACRHGRPRVADGSHTCTTCALAEAAGNATPPPPGWIDQARRALTRTTPAEHRTREEDHQ